MEPSSNNPEKGKPQFIISLHQMSIGKWYQIARFLLIIGLVVALGLYSINKVMDYRYKVVFIKTPCQLCQDLNKNQSSCIQGCFKYKLNLYPDGFGGWRYENGSPAQGYAHLGSSYGYNQNYTINPNILAGLIE